MRTLAFVLPLAFGCFDVSLKTGSNCQTVDVSCDDPCATSPWSDYTATAEECSGSTCYEVYSSNHVSGQAVSCASTTTNCTSASITFCSTTASPDANRLVAS